MNFEIKNLDDGKIAVYTPYNPEFVKRIKQAGGKWDGSSAWVLDERSIDAARSIMQEVYGRDDRPIELVNVRVKTVEEISTWHGPVLLFGRVIGSAWGRDSGAKLGEGVSFEAGGVRSGGSVKNWDTVIKEGSILTIYDVPRAAVEQKTNWNDDYGTFEILETQPNREALLAERKSLVKRIAEIDGLLEG